MIPREWLAAASRRTMGAVPKSLSLVRGNSATSVSSPGGGDEGSSAAGRDAQPGL